MNVLQAVKVMHEEIMPVARQQVVRRAVRMPCGGASSRHRRPAGAARRRWRVVWWKQRMLDGRGHASAPPSPPRIGTGQTIGERQVWVIVNASIPGSGGRSCASGYRCHRRLLRSRRVVVQPAGERVKRCAANAKQRRYPAMVASPGGIGQALPPGSHG